MRKQFQSETENLLAIFSRNQVNAFAVFHSLLNGLLDFEVGAFENGHFIVKKI